MNLMATDPSPILCARNLDDARQGTQIKECGQILADALPMLGYTNLYGLPKPYNPNHPIALWAAESLARCRWVIALGLACATEWELRRGKPHGAAWRLQTINDQIGPCWPADVAAADQVEPFNHAANLGRGYDYRHLPVHTAYREYLRARWRDDKRPPKWTRSHPPSWAPEWQGRA